MQMSTHAAFLVEVHPCLFPVFKLHSIFFSALGAAGNCLSSGIEGDESVCLRSNHLDKESMSRLSRRDLCMYSLGSNQL